MSNPAHHCPYIYTAGDELGDVEPAQVVRTCPRLDVIQTGGSGRRFPDPSPVVVADRTTLRILEQSSVGISSLKRPDVLLEKLG
jgi:hypothetical protein